jgi:hypothetical protein
MQLMHCFFRGGLQNFIRFIDVDLPGHSFRRVRQMELVCILSVIAAIAAVLYSICIASSKMHRHIDHRSLVFRPPDFAKSFEDLLAEGDVESVYRIMKGLEQRGDLHMIETESEIIITKPDTKPEPSSEDVEKIPVPGRMP